MTADEVESLVAIWTRGSYAQVGDRWAGISRALAAELDALVGLRGQVAVDAACGTGNTSLALARAGADVTGVDLTPALLEEASARARADGLAITWLEGNLLDLPVGDAVAAVTTSTFGAFLVDDPAACAAELVRVTCPGGLVATTAWGRDTPFSVIRSVVERRHPDLRADRRDTADWAEADGVAAHFAATPAELVDVESRTVPLAFRSLPEAFEFYSQYSGPMVMAREAVADAGGDWDQIGSEVVDRWGEYARKTDTGVELLAPYGRALVRVN